MEREAQPGRGAEELNVLLALGLVSVELLNGEEMYSLNAELLEPIATGNLRAEDLAVEEKGAI